MMKVVKDVTGGIIAYGPDNENYEPNVPEGCTLEIVEDYIPTLPAKTNSQLLAETDVWMSRISEDTVVALITKGIAQKSDYAPIVLERINYRRSLRNQPQI